MLGLMINYIAVITDGNGMFHSNDHNGHHCDQDHHCALE
jgi:hypothetical protein